MSESSSDTQEAFIELINNALASGVPIEEIRAGLKQIDTSKKQDVQKQFAEYVKSGTNKI